MTIPILTGAIAIAAAATAVGASNFPLGTYIYTGSVMDYRHEVLSASAGLTVKAVATNGTVLASARVVDSALSSGVNFRLEVPVATKASAKSAAIGDELNCVLESDDGTVNVSTQAMPAVAAANAITNLNIVAAAAKTFSAGDSGTVAVSEDYLKGLAPLMMRTGKAEYEPFADWDGDGASNYEEYKAGTNPFDPSDRLRITAFRPGREATLLSFEYAGGHLYVLDASPSLTNRTWCAEAFGVDSPDVPKQKTVMMEGNEWEDVGVMTLYLAPASQEKPSMFYTVRPE